GPTGFEPIFLVSASRGCGWLRSPQNRFTPSVPSTGQEGAAGYIGGILYEEFEKCADTMYCACKRGACRPGYGRGSEADLWRIRGRPGMADQRTSRMEWCDYQRP